MYGAQTVALREAHKSKGVRGAVQGKGKREGWGGWQVLAGNAAAKPVPEHALRYSLSILREKLVCVHLAKVEACHTILDSVYQPSCASNQRDCAILHGM